MKKKEELGGGREEKVSAEVETLDSLRLYFKDIRAAKLLTPEEEQELARRTVQGDDEAR